MDSTPHDDASLLRDWGHAAPSELAGALDALAAAGRPVRDLVTANPQEHGLAFDDRLLGDILAAAARDARTCRPNPAGQPAAREAVAAYHGDGLASSGVILTPGTSFGYWAAFRLLADPPGGEVLCPSPTYPLFDDLARLAGLTVRRYHMHEAGGRWAIDPDELAFQVTPRTRAIAVVSPHNPTGSVASADELDALGRTARRHGLAVLFDEVFREFMHDAAVRVERPAPHGAPLAVTLNGLSKMFSLPGLKGAWMAVEGDPARTGPFLRALEYLSDTFLPVSEPTQAAIPRLLAEGLGETRRFAAEYTRRMGDLVAAWRAEGVPAAMPQAGVYLPVGGCAPRPDDACLRLLRSTGILVHPGGLYDLPGNHVVMTAVARPPYPVREIAESLRRDAQAV